ncbi:acidic repeat-containing protein [Biomphalaria pfeifferi]|uniref:Acidic repeat-containing protein n=1 Tax=Biomphalaria pfeifferi TaxID=112525 RepID=A0AAD8BGH6_BIOPF|nr:acidic repeat-containing protein [Biomphalaria pfeifferi]
MAQKNVKQTKKKKNLYNFDDSDEEQILISTETPKDKCLSKNIALQGPQSLQLKCSPSENVLLDKENKSNQNFCHQNVNRSVNQEHLFGLDNFSRGLKLNCVEKSKENLLLNNDSYTVSTDVSKELKCIQNESERKHNFNLDSCPENYKYNSHSIGSQSQHLQSSKQTDELSYILSQYTKESKRISKSHSETETDKENIHQHVLSSCTNKDNEIDHLNQLLSEAELGQTKKSEVSSSFTEEDYVEVADVSIQTSQNKSNSFIYKPVLENTPDHIKEEDKFALRHHALSSDKNGDKDNEIDHLSRLLSEAELGQSKKCEINISFTEDDYVEVADVSTQTSQNKSNSFVNKSVLENTPDHIKDEERIALIQDASQLQSNILRENLSVGSHFGEESKVLAYDSDDSTTFVKDSKSTCLLVVDESCNEDDETNIPHDVVVNPGKENESITSEENDDLKNISRNMGAVSFSRYRQDSSSSDDEFERFLNRVKRPEQMKTNTPALSKPRKSLEDFIVHDSDVDTNSDVSDSAEDSDEMFYVKVNHSLDSKENNYRYKYEFDSLSDSNSSSDLNERAERECATNVPLKKNIATDPLKHTDPNISKTTEDRFLVPTSAPKTEKVGRPKERRLINSSSKHDHHSQSQDSICKSQLEVDENTHFLHSLSTEYPEFQRHPTASRFCKQFKETKVELAECLHDLFNQVIFENKLPKDLKIEWNPRYTKTAGTFSYRGNSTHYTTKITLSVKICDSPERVRDTLAHELCHAAVKLINGANEGHGVLWKSWAKRFNRKYPFMPVIVRCHDYTIKTKYTYQCTKCKYRIFRHSKSLDTEAKVCGHCRGKFEVFLTKDLDSSSGSTPTPRTPRTPNKFALFVKECYSAKKKETGMRHGDIMRILSKEFAEKNSLNN